jgi:hypothetical protein
MKRGKGIKNELRQLMAKEFVKKNGSKNIQDLLELELLAVLRSKPYEKKKPDQHFTYKIQEQWDRLPSLASLLC